MVKPILKKVSRFTQLDSLQDEDEEGRMEDDPEGPIEEEEEEDEVPTEEEVEEDKTYEVPMKIKFTFFSLWSARPPLSQEPTLLKWTELKRKRMRWTEEKTTLMWMINIWL